MSNPEEVLRKSLDKILAEQKYEMYNVTPISSGGANYTSVLFLSTMTSKHKEDLHLFGKVCVLGETFRKQVEIRIFDTENFAYTELGKIYRDIENECHVSEQHRLVLPKCYGYNSEEYEETLVLENLERRGYTTFDRIKTMDWQYAAAAVRELAKFHALSFAFQHKYPEKFAKVVEGFKMEYMSNEEQMEMMWKKPMRKAIETVREENREKFRKFVETVDSTTFKEYFKPLRRTAIIHTDYRMSNLMYKRHQNGDVDIIAVDYQTMQGSSPVVDLLYFIFTGTDEEFRRQHYDQLLDHYYSHLSRSMWRLQLNPSEIYSRDDFEYELTEKQSFGLAITVFALPIITVEAEHAPEVNTEMNLDSFSIQTTGKQYPERLNGIVNDFVKWGVLK